MSGHDSTHGIRCQVGNASRGVRDSVPDVEPRRTPASNADLPPGENAKVIALLRFAVARAGKFDRDFAEDLGWPKSTWSRLLAGERPVREIELMPLISEITARYEQVPPSHWAELVDDGIIDQLPGSPSRVTDGATLEPAEPEWVGRLEDQISFVLAVIRKVHSEAAAEVISEGLGGDELPAQPEQESTAVPAPRRSRRRG